MTLIACLHPRGCRTLFSDILVTSPHRSNGEVMLPTRIYLPPEQLGVLPQKPSAFRRKVIEVCPNLAMLWAGDYN